MDAVVTSPPAPPSRAAVPPGAGGRTGAAEWSRLQRVNLSRHAFGLAPFKAGEFGAGAAGPSEAHLVAVNSVLESFGGQIRRNLERLTLDDKAPARDALARFVVMKARGQRLVEAAELVWDFYYRLFSQRQTLIGGRLIAADRIALDCYQKVYTGLGEARSIPTPPPFSFMAAGLGPATYRRGIPVPQIGRLANPFPLVQLPHHRLLNPWTLGAIAHEAGHALGSDLGLSSALPRAVLGRVRAAGASDRVAKIWAYWCFELFADALSLLLIGPAAAASLFGVLARTPATAARFRPKDPHPPALLRMPILLFLLDRLGFRHDAHRMSRLWTTLYPSALRGRLPAELTASFRPAANAAIEALVFTPYPQFGKRRLVDVVNFGPKEAHMTDEAAGRLAAGTDPGIVPERFLIGAARLAVERRLAPPGRVAANFYKALERR